MRDVLERVRTVAARVAAPFSSLTARLVVTVVVLVAVVGIVVSTVTAAAIHGSLMNQLDGQVRALVQPPRLGGINLNNRGPGTFVAALPVDGGAPRGVIAGDSPGSRIAVPATTLRSLGPLPDDGSIHTIRIPGYGAYRVVSVVGGQLWIDDTPVAATLIAGLPLRDVNSTMRNLIGWEALLTITGVLAAALVGSAIVRRQLGPLRDVAATAHAVAALPLAAGEIGVTERVPERLTDAGTEVGQVGSALNTLLEHVERSLGARHRSEQQVRQFVADASHELRTPLTTIRGYTELARTRPDDEDAVATALAKVDEESGRMAALVEDLLLLARLDAGRPLERERVDLSRLLLEAVSDARVVAPGHRWQLVLPEDADGDSTPVEVLGDEQRLHQVATNLITNAWRHTPVGTTVTVSALADGFAVHDDGPGFPPELVDRAFERFTRADDARRRAGGSGLGLSLVQAIVASHGGVVGLESRPGDTTVTVRLPPPPPGPHPGNKS